MQTQKRVLVAAEAYTAAAMILLLVARGGSGWSGSIAVPVLLVIGADLVLWLTAGTRLWR